jgi:hypothetical protein
LHTFLHHSTTGEVSSNLLNNLGVIPGELAIASATRNPGKFKNFWIPAFAGMTVGRSLIYFATFSSGYSYLLAIA